ncbi:PTP27-like protein, partial [Mya arenaria]
DDSKVKVTVSGGSDYINASFIDSHKCEQYWPDPKTTKAYGEIQVESRSEDEYAEFTRRIFTVM